MTSDCHFLEYCLVTFSPVPVLEYLCEFFNLVFLTKSSSLFETSTNELAIIHERKRKPALKRDEKPLVLGSLHWKQEQIYIHIFINQQASQQEQATMAPRKEKSTKTKAPKTNEKGEVISWDSNSPDGKALKALFDGGLITDETAKIVKKNYPRFRVYASRTLNSALTNERKRLEKEVDTQKARGSSGEFCLLIDWLKLLLFCVFHGVVHAAYTLISLQQ